jgi:hypothetical protein
MGKHVPLPSDPVAKAAEKKRRFAVYRREWKQRQKRLSHEQQAAQYRTRRELQQRAARLHIDLCLVLGDLTIEQLRNAIHTAESWIAKL